MAAKDGFPTTTTTTTNRAGRKTTKVTPIWTETLTDYTDTATVFTGPKPGYVGRCTAANKEVDFFIELLGDAVKYIVTTTNKFMREREQQGRRSKRSRLSTTSQDSQPDAAPLQPAATATLQPSQPVTNRITHQGSQPDAVLLQPAQPVTSSSTTSQDFQPDAAAALQPATISATNETQADPPLATTEMQADPQLATTEMPASPPRADVPPATDKPGTVPPPATCTV
jgi:hypothetical protein